MKKILLCAAACALIGTAGVSAYDLASDSPTSRATEGRFSGDKDNYLDLTGWSDLTSNVLFLQFGGPGNASSSKFQIGTGYWLDEAMYLGGFLETALPRTNMDNSNEVANSDLNLDPSGELISIEESIQKSIEENRLHETNFTVLLGMQMGDMSLGVKNVFEQRTNSSNGTFAPTANWGTGTGLYGVAVLNSNPLSIGTGGQTNDRTTVTNAAGEVTYESVTAYDQDGLVNDSGIADTLGVGVRMPLGDMTLETMLNVGFTMYNMDRSAGLTVFERVAGNNLPDYNDLENVVSHTRTEGRIDDSFSVLNPSLNTLISMPLSETAEFETGVNYALDWYLSGASAYELSENEYSATSDGIYVVTTTTESVWSKTSDRSGMAHTVGIPLGITVQPADTFRYSVGYTPSYTVTTFSELVNAEWSSTATTEHTDDNVETVVVEETTTLKGIEQRVLEMELSHNLEMGAQFYLTERVRVNTGTNVSMRPLNWTRETIATQGNSEYRQTETVGDNDPVVQNVDAPTDLTQGNADSESVNTVVATPNVNYRLGFTYLFSEDMELDFRYYGGGATNANTNIFNAGVWSVLMTIRY